MQNCCGDLKTAVDNRCDDCLQSGQPNDECAATYAVQTNNLHALRILVNRFPNEHSPRGWTPLMQAVDDQNIKALRIIIENVNTNINYQNDWGMTSPMMACYSGFSAGLQLMLQAGQVDLELRDNHGLNCEMQAAKNGYVECIRLVHAQSPPVLVCDKFSRNPMHYAYYYGNQDVADYYATLPLFEQYVAQKDAFGNIPQFYCKNSQIPDLYGRSINYVPDNLSGIHDFIISSVIGVIQ